MVRSSAVAIQLPISLNAESLPAYAFDALRQSSLRVDSEGHFSRDNWSILRKAGLLGLPIPREYGGPGVTPSVWLEVIRRVAMACPSTGLGYLMHLCATSVILATASEELKRRVLPGVGAGDVTVAYAGTEHATGTNFWALASCAVPLEGGWHLHLTKDWATLAEAADIFVVPTRAHPEASHEEISLFLVDRSSGVRTASDWRGTGMRGSSSGSVEIDAVVPDLHLMGVPGRANDYITTDMFNLLLLSHASLYAGIAEEALRLAVEHARNRSFAHERRPLAATSLWQSRLGEMSADISTAQALIEKGGRLVSDEPASGRLLREGLAAKLTACSVARRSTDLALQICGGSGYNRGTRVEMLWRDARAGSLMRPTDEVAQIILGRLEIGLEPFSSEE